MKLPREFPDVKASTCTACGDCLRICPTQCLELIRRIAWLPRPMDCVSCAACVWVCPVDAITMTDLGPSTSAVVPPVNSAWP